MALSREPQNISKKSWYYEYPTYLLLVHEERDENGRWLGTHSFKLPWRMIETSRKRRPAPRKRR